MNYNANFGNWQYWRERFWKFQPFLKEDLENQTMKNIEGNKAIRQQG
jgi:hypothetical protein